MKLIALDLDGTTFNSKKEISKENIEAIQKVQEHGHIVMVLSGRAVHEIQPDLKRHGLNCHVGANNGATLFVNNQLVNMITLQPNQSKKITDILEQDAIPYTVSTNNGVFTPKDLEQRIEKALPSVHESGEIEMFKAFIEQYGHKPFHQIDDLLNDTSSTIQKYFVITLDPKQKEKLELELNQVEEISFASTTDYVDIMHRNASKGNALKFIAEYLQIPLEDTIAIGDESNDIPMFQIAGLAVAMGNASDEIKKHSDVVTLSNDEHGVAYALHNYVLGGQSL
jgi:Cof subfamily protein (haloacid dehalogenase superfamily)